MPLIGMAVGHAVGNTLGSLADYVASAALLALGAFLLFGGGDETEAASCLHALTGSP